LKNHSKNLLSLLSVSCPILFLVSAFIPFSGAAQSPEAALKQLLDTKELKSAHVGIYVFDDSNKKVISDYQSDHYFVPASNTKLFSLYAGMKYLGDSLLGALIIEMDTAIFITPTGDPSFLHPDYSSQPLMDFLKKRNKKVYLMGYLGGLSMWQENPLGEGWAWDDYSEDYSVERSEFPIYGNFIRWTQEKSPVRSNPAFEETATISSYPEISWPVRYSLDSTQKEFLVKRLMDSNVFIIHPGFETSATKDVPFITNNMYTAAKLLQDSLGKPVSVFVTKNTGKGGWSVYPPDYQTPNGGFPRFYNINSRPADSVFIPMMYRSDNFFAEQVLLMVSQKWFAFMKDEVIIDTLLNGPLADLPQKPSWVDGSGLSRFNMFTPQDFVTLLTKFKNEFGMDRMKRILPTGGNGTLKNYYHADSAFVFAKTGSLTHVICLSGFVYTKHNRLLEFSILVNNFMGSGSAVRHAVEKYVEFLREKY